MSTRLKITFCTTNQDKFRTAKDACAQFNIALEQAAVEVDEIQSEDAKKVAIDKAQKAYEKLKKPLAITDDSWSFPGLNGFPGAYMHSMNTWLSPADFLRLTLPLQDRRVVLTQHLVYTDGDLVKVFESTTQGELLKEVRGNSKHSSLTIMTLEGDNGLSMAEVMELDHDKSALSTAKVWKNFAVWYTATASSSSANS